MPTRAAVNTAMSGWMQKINGKMAIDQMSERLRRYSRSSLRTIARTRRGLMLIVAASASWSISSR